MRRVLLSRLDALTARKGNLIAAVCVMPEGPVTAARAARSFDRTMMPFCASVVIDHLVEQLGKRTRGDLVHAMNQSANVHQIKQPIPFCGSAAYSSIEPISGLRDLKKIWAIASSWGGHRPRHLKSALSRVLSVGWAII